MQGIRIVLLALSISAVLHMVDGVPVCAVSPFVLNNFADVYGCGINRCECPFNGFLYRCLPTEAEHGICDFQGGGFPFMAAIIIVVIVFVLALHRCFGFCTASKDKTAKLEGEAESKLTMDTENGEIAFRDATPLSKPLTTIPIKNPDWEHVSAGLDGDIHLTSSTSTEMVVINAGGTFSPETGTCDWLHILNDKDLNKAPAGRFSARKNAVIKLETLNDWRLKLLISTVFASFIAAMVFCMSPLGINYDDTLVTGRGCVDQFDRDCWVQGSSTFRWLGRVNDIDYDTAFFAVLLQDTAFSINDSSVVAPKTMYSVSLANIEENGNASSMAATRQTFERELDCSCGDNECTSYNCTIAYLISLRTRSPGELSLQSEVSAIDFFVNFTDWPFAEEPKLIYERGEARNIGYRTIVLILCIIALANMVFYAFQMSQIPYKEWTKEQFLILQFSIATFLDSNSVSTILIWTAQTTREYIALAGVIESIAVPWVFTLMLLLIDGLRVEVYPNIREKPSFYVFKGMFAALLGSILLAMTVIISEQTIESAARGDNYDTLRALSIIEVILTFLFLAYVAGLLIATSIKMAALDQVRTRYRQLAFRQFFCQFLYLFILTLVVMARTLANVIIQSYITQYPVLNQELLIRSARTMATVTNAVLMCYTFLPAKGCRLMTSVLYQYKEDPNFDHWNDQGNSESSPGTATLLQSLRQSLRSVIPKRTSRPVFCLQTAVRLYNFTSLAYAENPQDRAFMKALSDMGVRLIADIREDELGNRAIVLRGKDHLIVSFRGTVSREQLVTVDMDTKFVMSSLGMDDDRWQPNTDFLRILDSGVPQVHRGFYISYMNLRDAVFDAVETNLMEEGPVPLLMTGHSLGGALATLCSLDFVARLENIPVAMYNFGSPRVGDCTFSRIFNQMVPTAFRVIVDGDVVVGSPTRSGVLPCGFGKYVHVGIPVVLDPSGSGSLIIQPSFVEQTMLLRSHRKVLSHLLSTLGRALSGSIYQSVHMSSRNEAHELYYSNGESFSANESF